MTNKQLNKAAKKYLDARGANFVRRVPVTICGERCHRLTFTIKGDDSEREYEIQVTEETLDVYSRR